MDTALFHLNLMESESVPASHGPRAHRDPGVGSAPERHEEAGLVSHQVNRGTCLRDASLRHRGTLGQLVSPQERALSALPATQGHPRARPARCRELLAPVPGSAGRGVCSAAGTMQGEEVCRILCSGAQPLPRAGRTPWIWKTESDPVWTGRLPCSRGPGSHPGAVPLASAWHLSVPQDGLKVGLASTRPTRSYLPSHQAAIANHPPSARCGAPAPSPASPPPPGPCAARAGAASSPSQGSEQSWAPAPVMWFCGSCVTGTKEKSGRSPPRRSQDVSKAPGSSREFLWADMVLGSTWDRHPGPWAGPGIYRDMGPREERAPWTT